MLIPLPIIIVGSHLAVADVVPSFDIEQNCRLNLSGTTAPGPDVDKAMKSCVSDEQQARDQLQKQWSQFPGQGRAPQKITWPGPEATSFYSRVSK